MKTEDYIKALELQAKQDEAELKEQAAEIEVMRAEKSADQSYIKQQVEQIGALSASLELALNQQKVDKAEIERLRGLLTKAHDIIVAEATGSITSRVWRLLDEIEQALKGGE